MQRMGVPQRRETVISNKMFIIALGLFGAAYLWLAALIDQWGVARVPSIGGGSYSLDKFVYSALIILLCGAVSIFALVLGLARQDAVLSRRALVLSGIGMTAFAASCFLYGHNLN